MPPPTDHELIARSIAAPAHFEQLFRRHYPLVHRYVCGRIGRSGGEDVAAEVFVRAFGARVRYRPQTADARAWLLGIATNLVADRRRMEARELRALQRLGGDTAAAEDPRSAALSPELARGLRKLARGDREALLLLAWGELSYAEIAHALDLPLGTVRSRIHRARRQLAASARPALAPTVGEACA